MQSAWKNNVLILFLSTTHGIIDTIMRKQKQSFTTSISTKIARKSFGSSAWKELLIPIFIDEYNHNMRHVDRADQLRSYNPRLRRIRRGDWYALWNFIFNVIFINSYLLSSYKSQAQFRNALILALFNKDGDTTAKSIFIAKSTFIPDHHQLGYC